MSDTTKIVVLDGYTINPGDNPWDPLLVLGDCTIHDRTSPDQKLVRAADATLAATNKETPRDEHSALLFPDD